MRLHKYFTVILMMAAVLLTSASVSFAQDDKGEVTVKKTVVATKRVKRCVYVNVPVRRKKRVLRKRKCVCTNVNAGISAANKQKAIELDGREKAVVAREVAVTNRESDVKKREDAVAAAEAKVAQAQNELDAAITKNIERSNALDTRAAAIAVDENSWLNSFGLLPAPYSRYAPFVLLALLGLLLGFLIGRSGRRSDVVVDEAPASQTTRRRWWQRRERTESTPSSIFGNQANNAHPATNQSTRRMVVEDTVQTNDIVELEDETATVDRDDEDRGPIGGRTSTA